MSELNPIANWPLTDDARDSAGAHHGRASGVTFENGAARFEGNGRIDIDAPPPGRASFTIALWTRVPHDLWDSAGDLVSRYDPVKRNGFALSIKDNPAGCVSVPNVRNAEFWIDAASEPQWQNCGRPGNTSVISALQAHNNHLYAASHETADGRGHVYRHGGGDAWHDCGAPDERHCIYSLASAHGKLYASTCFDSLAGSLFENCDWNTTSGAGVYFLDDSGDWIDCGQPWGDTPGRINLFTIGGELYAGNIYMPQVMRYDGDKQWTTIATLDVAITSAGALGGGILTAPKALKPAYFPDHQHRHVDGDTVQRIDAAYNVAPAGFGLNAKVYAFTRHAGQIFAGTWPRGATYRTEDNCKTWINAGGCGCDMLEGEIKGEIMAMASHHGQLYVGTLPLAEVYRYDGDHAWTKINRLDFAPGAPIRRIWSMAEHDGKLFCGTLPGGEVHAMSVGAGVSDSHALDGQWHHLTAVRDERELRLYIDGQRVAANAADELNLDGGDLRIGSGPYDHFTGELRDVRLYGAALDVEAVQSIADTRPVGPRL